MRDIEDILLFRDDISPFLVHLTKKSGESTARQVLETILGQEKLLAGSTQVSDIKYGGFTNQLDDQQNKDFFCAVCFTETPLSEVQCLLDINYRQVNLEPYGLVFLKEKLQTMGVSPVLYLNNENGGKDNVAQALYSLTVSHPDEAKEILPLFSVFGHKIKHPGAKADPAGSVDFRWEREWRYPASRGDLQFSLDNVFIGLCPHEEIQQLEARFQSILFIDPRRPMKWYATKLIQARHRSGLKYSVV